MQKAAIMTRCTRCKHSKKNDQFLSKRGGITKMCLQCREQNKSFKEKAKCEHGRRKTTCKECGTATLCEHGRRNKNACRECHNPALCEIRKDGGECIDCEKSQYCDHDRRRYLCKDCKGDGICEHDRIKARCKECKGSGICEHDHVKASCAKCKGGGKKPKRKGEDYRDSLYYDEDGDQFDIFNEAYCEIINCGDGFVLIKKKDKKNPNSSL
jgi:hypothetical protein